MALLQNYINSLNNNKKQQTSGLDRFKSTFLTGTTKPNQSMTPYQPSANMINSQTQKPAVGKISASPSAVSPTVKNNYIASQVPAQSPAAPANQASPQINNASFSKAYNDYLAQYSPNVTTSKEKAETKQKATEKKDSAYLEYLKTIFDPKQAQVARENVDRLNQQISSETLRARGEEERIRANQAGQLEAGLNADLGKLNRESSRTLADLAIAKGYSSDLLQQYTDAGATLYEAEQEAQKEANELLSLEEATALQVPYGTTRGEARLSGIIPTAPQAEGFNLSEGQARYDAQGNLIAQRGKTYAPGTGAGEGSTYYNGKKLTASQKTAVDNLNAVESSFDSYKALYDKLVGKSGVNLLGEDSAELAGAYNALIFQIAQAAGTGALQAADREVVEAMIPNPTTVSGASGSLFKGGKSGGLKAIESARAVFKNKINAIVGAAPESTTGQSGVLRSPDGTQEVDLSELTPAELQEAKAAGWR